MTSEDPFGKEEKRLKYIDQEKCDYIPDNLEQAREQTKDVDPHSLTTDTSDSGMLGSNRASSEVGTEDISGKKICGVVIRRYVNVKNPDDISRPRWIISYYWRFTSDVLFQLC